MLALAGGCYAETGVEPAYVEATAVPVDVTVAPQYNYEGRTVYYANDHWYAQDHGRWVYYRNEPDVLYRHRVQVQQAPRAHNYRRGPEHREIARPRREAPSAIRVQ